MKSVRYFTLNFSGFTTAACEKQGYLRLIDIENAYYTNPRTINYPVLFLLLKKKKKLTSGVSNIFT